MGYLESCKEHFLALIFMQEEAKFGQLLFMVYQSFFVFKQLA